ERIKHQAPQQLRFIGDRAILDGQPYPIQGPHDDDASDAKGQALEKLWPAEDDSRDCHEYLSNWKHVQTQESGDRTEGDASVGAREESPLHAHYNVFATPPPAPAVASVDGVGALQLKRNRAGKPDRTPLAA